MKSKHKRLPPHSWEAHPKADKKDAHKQLTIVVVAIGAIVVLALLLFLGQKQFAGKAFYTGAENSFGIANPGKIASGTPFTVTVKANTIDKEVVALSFELPLNYYKEGVKYSYGCDKVESLLGWDESNGVYFTEASCDTNKVTFKYATINYQQAKKGDFEIAKLYFKGIEGSGDFLLTFGDVIVINLADNTPITLTIENPTIEVVETKPACTDSDGGYNLYVKGYATGFNSENNKVLTWGDYCTANALGAEVLSGEYLKEAICKNNEVTYVSDTKCPNGCQDGACIVSEPVCGNGIVEPELDEICDGTAFSSSMDTCVDKDFLGGTPTCKDACTSVDYTSCQKSQVGEACALSPVGALASTCDAGLTCEEGTCTAPPPAPVCGNNKVEAGEACDNSSNPLCIGCKSIGCTLQTHCGANENCVNNVCVSTLTLEKPIDIKLTQIESSGVATTSVGKAKDYDITVTLTPSVDLPANYLMIASVNYGNQQSTKLIEGNNAALTKDSSKTFGFKHTVDGSATNFTVSVMVWNGYLTEGFEFEELVPIKEKSYAIG